MNRHYDEVEALIRLIEKEAEQRGYERGKADAKREMLMHLGAADPAFSSVPDYVATNYTDYASQEVMSDGGARAPKGSVRKLVHHALRASPGLAPAEILDHARTPIERMIKPASVRAELNAGRKRGFYETRDGKWFLSGEVGEAEGQSSEGQPSASDQDEEGGDTHAAALNFSDQD
jgi:hypothetical protein